MQNSRSRKDPERPFDSPDASVRGGDGRVHDAMGMAVGTVMIVLVMALPVRAEA